MTKVYAIWDYRGTRDDIDSIWSTRQGAEQRYNDLGGTDSFSIDEYELKEERKGKLIKVELNEEPIELTENLS